MKKMGSGHFVAELANLSDGAKYFFRFEDGRERPDPASRFQPDGVHGPSEVVDLDEFEWSDASWRGHELQPAVFYELHVGTYTPEGTFEALIAHLADLKDLGITTIELMPVAQFPGARNWGYDGVQPYAVQNSYGGPRGLQKFVDAAHRAGLSVALDVVYNHLGPEGNYFNDYGPYFTEKYRTPWGSAINYDGPDSGDVRGFFINNALYWMEKFHIDMLRLDAVHGIFDFGARHFLAELQDSVDALAKRLGRKLFLIAESDLNDSRLLRSPSEGGYGLPAQWSDDFHHSLHTLLTGEGSGYYEDFGEIKHLAETMRKGWLYAGQYSQHRRRKHGSSASGLARSSFVVCIQNHDQVGNRARGDRLAELVDFESQKLAAGVTLLAPFIPLIFMGEEYGETAPFQYFTSHSDPRLIEAVRKGRREEFASFGWQGEVPDPQEEPTFERSKLRHELKEREPHRTLRELYQELLQIRRKYDLAGSGRVEVFEEKNSITITAEHDGTALAAIFAFASQKTERSARLPEGSWKLRLDSGDARWRGSGSCAPKEIRGGDSVTLARLSFALYERIPETS